MKEKYIELLEKYLEKVKNDDLEIEEGINLLDFYANDVNSYKQEKEQEEEKQNDVSSMIKYMTLGWLISLKLNLN
jgi:acyl-CoA reductase-like NAD-dependent aldehyde dehydrogenase